MSAWRLAAATFGVALVIVYAGASGYWVQTDSAWYSALKRPWWQPPDVVFGLIWPYNFVVLGISMALVAGRLPRLHVAIAVGLFAASVASATLWSYWFYGPHLLGPAAAALAATVLLTLPLLYFVFQASTLLGWLLVPYQCWIAIATSLSWGYWRLN